MKMELLNYSDTIKYNNETIAYNVIQKLNKVIVLSKSPKKYQEINLINEQIIDKLKDKFVITDTILFDFRAERSSLEM